MGQRAAYAVRCGFCSEPLLQDYSEGVDEETHKDPRAKQFLREYFMWFVRSGERRLKPIVLRKSEVSPEADFLRIVQNRTISVYDVIFSLTDEDMCGDLQNYATIDSKSAISVILPDCDLSNVVTQRHLRTVEKSIDMVEMMERTLKFGESAVTSAADPDVVNLVGVFSDKFHLCYNAEHPESIERIVALRT
ncbi:hypothetical protein QAD02_001445 [Eretmocerus hayati]|uniref:Uncharacterized protein n=1 Tax=Eretmocerus hayati TaxID=131215 RepID=A0ACC2NGZ7_9HYME|nr:hypothetical protein QAD02_001445 [Eretmocerus hayati]